MTFSWGLKVTRSFLAKRSRPTRPKDLLQHPCINLRLPTHGDVWPWEFAKSGRELKVRVDGPLVVNSLDLMLKAVLAGLGFAYLPAKAIAPHVARKELAIILQDWSPSYPGYRLYYAKNRQRCSAFALLVEALRYRTA